MNFVSQKSSHQDILQWYEISCVESKPFRFSGTQGLLPGRRQLRDESIAHYTSHVLKFLNAVQLHSHLPAF